MDNLLQNIPHVAVYLDDILVTGKTEEEHLQNLDQVLKRMKEAGFLPLPIAYHLDVFTY